jgi:DNA mismatch repair protein MutH
VAIRRVGGRSDVGSDDHGGDGTMAPRTPPPRDEDELLRRARALAGRTVAELAARLDRPVPADLRRAKGFVGQLIEDLLGATAGSRAEPDFPHLGVELKTLPVDAAGRPRESTYVCTLPLDGTLAASWEASWVRRKLARVLWVPVVVGDGPPGERVVGTPVLWSPSPEEEATLRADWEELATIVALGELWDLHGRHGAALQVRPKAASSSELSWVLGEEGAWVRDVGRGFYLRPAFTAALIAARLRMPRPAPPG